MVSTVVLSIRADPEDVRRWKRIISDSDVVVAPGKKLGIRVYLKDKHRWSKIVKKSAIEDKIAADVFREMLDLAERRRLQLKDKKVADIFKYLLDLYEREMLLWGNLA